MTTAPQQISYIIYIEGVEEAVAKKRKPGLLRRIFGVSASGAMTGTRNSATSQAQGVIDHSTIPAVLAKLADLQKRQKECLDDICARSERLPGFDYTRRETVEIWVGPTSKISGAGTQAKFHPGDAYRFAGDDITAENIGAALYRCDSAESRASAIALAMTPPEKPKLMKPISLKKRR